MRHAPTPRAVVQEAATPIWISRRARLVAVIAGSLTLAALLWRVPMLASLSVGGVALAVAFSFPVRMLSRVMAPRTAIALTMFLAAALLALAITVVVPIIGYQMRALVSAGPDIARQLDERVPPVFDWLAAHGLVQGSPERALADTQQRLLAAAQQFGGRILGQLGQVVSGVAGLVVALLGIVLVSVYLLADGRRIQAAALRACPHPYRRDARVLRDALGHTLSRYLGGLALSMAIEGVLAAIAFQLLGVPYALLLGAWVSVMAVVPYVGTWFGYGPGVLLALAISPTRALVTLLVCTVINLVVANVVTPRIQGSAVHVHPMLVFFAVITGGELFGLPGVVLAVPTMAVLRVVHDFLRQRVRVAADASRDLTATFAPARDATGPRSATVSGDTPASRREPAL